MLPKLNLTSSHLSILLSLPPNLNNLTHFPSMAESILYSVATNILTKLGSHTLKELRSLWGVNDELEKLQDTLSAIQAVLVDAEEQLSHSNRVKNWVSKLKDVVYEIEDLMDECAYDTLRRQVLAKDPRKRKQVRIQFSKFKSNLTIGSKIKGIRKRLNAVNEDKTQFSFSERVLDTSSIHDEFKKKRETYSYILDEEVIGRNNDKEAIMKLLLDTNTKEDIAIISIVGMGGLGKTTLTQSVYNNRLITKHFELKLWVCVSEDFDAKTIGEKIIEAATKKRPESFILLDSLANELRKQIDGKKYLLVMDDVWNEDYEKWVSLKRLLMGGAKGSRILITTRGQKVADTFDTTFLHSLQNLDECNSWLLFKKMTFLEGHGEEFENSNLIPIGKEIVARLRGVPLAIRTIGRLLKEKKSQKFWLFFKDKELCQVMKQVKNDDLDYMLSILELSYKHLPANLKQCFLYCALFPKDHVIQKDELILLWRAQGFIPPNDKNELDDIGEDYFLELLSKSFFQDVTKDEQGKAQTCKMHDLMHDLACSIAKGEYIHGLKNNIDKRTHHLSLSSLSRDESKELLKTLSNARKLRTFLVLDRYFLREWESHSDKVFEDYSRLRTLKLNLDRNAKVLWFTIGRLKHLRYLSISGLDFQYLPNCFTELYNLETLSLQYWRKLETLPCDIKNLINLKHLNLRANCSLEFLPNSTIELCKLEALILKHCSNLKELPRDIKKLVNLKHFDISYCDALSYIPIGLGELTNLQTMKEFVIGENIGAGLSELNGLNKLNGCLRIRNLQFCSDVDLQTNAMFLQLKSGLCRLELEWDNPSNEPTIDVYERVLDCLQPHSNLEYITIIGYTGEKLCNWLSSGSLGHLVEICLNGCERLQHLPQFDQFPYLKSLYLEDLPNIKYIVNDDSDFSSTVFPCLEALRILGMSKLKRWRKGTMSTKSSEPTRGSFSVTFPCLSLSVISGCSLRVMMSWHAPLLKELQISDLKKGHSIEEDEFDVVPWENFENLSSLCLLSLSKLDYLPKRLRQATTLQCLTLWLCENLKCLPEWIHNLASLRELKINSCRKLASLPEGIRNIHSLQSFTIDKCSILEERCKKDIGEEWPKIAHIPNVCISNTLQ